MAKYKYSPSPKSIGEFFKEIQKVRVPEKVTIKYLKSIGFKKTNDKYIPGVLKSLGFIDSSNKPTDRWEKFRNTKKAPKIMAKSIKEAYSDLFNIYNNAYQKDREALINFFSSNTKISKGTQELMVKTFKVLCGLADFDALKKEEEIGIGKIGKEGLERVNPPKETLREGPTININIQLQLPETKDAEVYEKLFKSLKEHILS